MDSCPMFKSQRKARFMCDFTIKEPSAKQEQQTHQFGSFPWYIILCHSRGDPDPGVLQCKFVTHFSASHIANLGVANQDCMKCVKIASRTNKCRIFSWPGLFAAPEFRNDSSFNQWMTCKHCGNQRIPQAPICKVVEEYTFVWCRSWVNASLTKPSEADLQFAICRTDFKDFASSWFETFCVTCYCTIMDCTLIDSLSKQGRFDSVTRCHFPRDTRDEVSTARNIFFFFTLTRQMVTENAMQNFWVWSKMAASLIWNKSVENWTAGPRFQGPFGSALFQSVKSSSMLRILIVALVFCDDYCPVKDSGP